MPGLPSEGHPRRRHRLADTRPDTARPHQRRSLDFLDLSPDSDVTTGLRYSDNFGARVAHLDTCQSIATRVRTSVTNPIESRNRRVIVDHMNDLQTLRNLTASLSPEDETAHRCQASRLTEQLVTLTADIAKLQAEADKVTADLDDDQAPMVWQALGHDELQQAIQGLARL